MDDEEDVLDSLSILLDVCKIDIASSFEEANKLLKENEYDIAILDIMGVQGYELLEVANKAGIIAVMLTAHALSPEDIIKSYQEGAASYLPKDEMVHIATFLSDILEAKEKGKHPWWRWLDRFTTYFDKKFGHDWRNKDKEFWEDFGDWG